MKFDLLKNIEQGGCSAKLPASQLKEALKDLPKSTHPDLLVSIETHDDAGVYKINSEQALIQTLDFFPPVCSDPYEFGQIAAANALSDVYAMGGEVLTALNILLFPAVYPLEVMKEILQGGNDKVIEAGGIIVGGHTIADTIPKYGLAVTGIIHPDRIITNSKAIPGDVLILTKPLGGGIILAGKKINETSDQNYRAVIDSMKQLNNKAASIMQKYNVKCATDITGYGFLGHALKLAEGSNVTLSVNINKFPIFDGVEKLLQLGCIPGAAFRNQEFAETNCMIDKSVNYDAKMLLFDAQTSGGLLISVPENKAVSLLQELKDANQTDSSIIGYVKEKSKHFIELFD